MQIEMTRMELRAVISFLRRVYAGQAEADELARLVNKLETIQQTGEVNARSNRVH